jgi:hypothetical protein
VWLNRSTGANHFQAHQNREGRKLIPVARVIKGMKDVTIFRDRYLSKRVSINNGFSVDVAKAIVNLSGGICSCNGTSFENGGGSGPEMERWVSFVLFPFNFYAL